MLRRLLESPLPVDLRRTLAPIRRGRSDPCFTSAADGFWRATRTAEGPGTIHLRQNDDTGATIEAEAWGPGAEWLLHHASDLIGCYDSLEGFDASLHPVVADLHRRMPGLRVGRTLALTETAIPTICEQKVTGFEAHRAWRQIVRGLGEPAPGPVELWVPPPAEALAGSAYYELHLLGVERKRADTIRRVAAQAPRLDAMDPTDIAAITERLSAISGMGPWSAAEVAMIALGDPDAVSVGDYHLPNIVGFALAGEQRGTDERMLELLEPFAGHRGRVIRLIMSARIAPQRKGPRLAPRSIANI